LKIPAPPPVSTFAVPNVAFSQVCPPLSGCSFLTDLLTLCRLPFPFGLIHEARQFAVSRNCIAVPETEYSPPSSLFENPYSVRVSEKLQPLYPAFFFSSNRPTARWSCLNNWFPPRHPPPPFRDSGRTSLFRKPDFFLHMWLLHLVIRVFP